MSGALDLLDQLEQEQSHKRPTTPKKAKLPSSFVSEGARKTARSRSLPSPVNIKTLQPPPPSSAARSPSVGGESMRRISFADVPRPETRKIWIPTKTECLASGFVYDPRLKKWGVSEDEWSQFSKELITAADAKSTNLLMWGFQKKGVIKKVQKDLRYNGDCQKVIKKFNNFWKNKKGFQVWLELPTPKGQADLNDDIVQDTPEERERAKREAKCFRVVVSGIEATSAYHRTSSFSKATRGEGAGVLRDEDNLSAVEGSEASLHEHAVESPLEEPANILSPLSPRSDYHDALSQADPNELESASPKALAEEPRLVNQNENGEPKS